MKKIILTLLISFTALSAAYVIKPDGTLTPTTTQDVTTPPPTDTWVGTALPTQAFNVLNYGLKGDGVTDDSVALNALAENIDVTNWYFPAGSTFLLSNIKIPSHVKAIYGSGTIISKAYTRIGGDTNPIGALYIDNTNINGLVIDGINFIQQKSPNWPESGRGYGHITAMGTSNIANMEIRNCSFDMKEFDFNGIKIFGSRDDTKVIRNMRIHHNTFTNFGEFGVEIFNLDTRPEGLGRTMIGIHLNDNHFIGSGKGSLALSFVKVRGGAGNTGIADGTESYIYNNTFTNVSWAMEVGACSGVHCHNNKATGVSGYTLLIDDSTVVDLGKNFFYNNHLSGDGLGTASVKIMGSGHPEIHHNFFNCRVITELRDTVDSTLLNPYIHDNTIVQDIGTTSSSYIVSFSDKTAYGTFQNNKIYGSDNVARGIYVSSSSGGSNLSILDNDIYLKYPSTIAFDVAGTPVTKSGNAIIINYTETIPTN